LSNVATRHQFTA